MARKNENRKISFDGRFTPHLRKLLHERRQQLGLSYANLSAFLNVNWSTLRKWELGPTTHCGVAMRPQLAKFLNGELDNALRQLQDKYRFSSPTRFLPSTVLSCIERIGNTYQLCNSNPELKCRLISELSEKTAEILNRLISPQRYSGCQTLSKRKYCRRPRQSSIQP